MEDDDAYARPHFSLVVTPRQDDTQHFEVHSLSIGITQEVILTMVRNWLKLAEDNYHEDFLRRK